MFLISFYPFLVIACDIKEEIDSIYVAIVCLSFHNISSSVSNEGLWKK